MIRACLTALAVLTALPAAAQDRRPSHCIAIAEADPALEYVQLAAFGTPLPDPHTVRISFVDHATFLIETAGGLSAATDFTGFLGATRLIPDVVTMNNAHQTHFTAFPDPAIPHVLEGWARDGVAADHHLDLGEMLVRNVPTDVRGFDRSVVRENGNSIFVFEVAGLCIGHLGHLHHEPDEMQYASLGRLDVVMAPVDGGLTLDLPTMIRVLERLRSSVVIPMHWFGAPSLERFLAGMSGEFAIRREGAGHLEISLRTLPDRPTVIVLDPEPLHDPE
ncbi:MBL fold metallo-hydrolase [Rhodovulum strictum]|uniref:Zn-dependent hydrolase n=1 Tax=Rhodovulum strictum TaxID=58314 RepID=A0A844BJY2_9RHOB|nr:MBL fold metallo-hydrolase [Rhodovulum strictum]MRH21332.1 Zn-dependent hydrolase [Rhodovulum strictum]